MTDGVHNSVEITMMKKDHSDRSEASGPAAAWERPALKYLGNVSEIFLFPGNGKVSTANYDTGDTPFKPKGQEPK
ncbi:MAG TPA: hypothetical protein VL309_10205 [Vicinamibacterales bacterium]|nr:hypothetical protein [Vicinamibacterales bacterium]